MSALDRSDYFILLASPEAPGSKWVAREIEHWKTTTQPIDRLLPVLTDGEWVREADGADLDRSSRAVPAAVTDVFKEEPHYLDLRWARTETQLDLNHRRFRYAVAQPP